MAFTKGNVPPSFAPAKKNAKSKGNVAAKKHIVKQHNMHNAGMQPSGPTMACPPGAPVVTPKPTY